MIPSSRSPLLALTVAAALAATAAPSLDCSELLDGAPSTEPPAETHLGEGPEELPPPPAGVEFPEGVWESRSGWQRGWLADAASSRLGMAPEEWERFSAAKRGKLLLAELDKLSSERLRERLQALRPIGAGLVDGKHPARESDLADFVRDAFGALRDYPVLKPDDELQDLIRGVRRQASIVQSEMLYREAHPLEAARSAALDGAKRADLTAPGFAQLYDNSKQAAEDRLRAWTAAGARGRPPFAAPRKLELDREPRWLLEPKVRYQKFSPRGWREALQRVLRGSHGRADRAFRRAFDGMTASSERKLLHDLALQQKAFDGKRQAKIDDLEALLREEEGKASPNPDVIRQIKKDLSDWRRKSSEVLITSVRLHPWLYGEEDWCKGWDGDRHACVAVNSRISERDSEDDPIAGIQKALAHELQHAADELRGDMPAQRYMELRAQLTEARAFRDEGRPAGRAAAWSGELEKDFFKDALVRNHRHELSYGWLWAQNLGPDALDDPARGWRWRLALLYQVATWNRNAQRAVTVRGQLEEVAADYPETSRTLVAVWEDRAVREEDKVGEFVRRAQGLPEGRVWMDKVRALPEAERDRIRRGHEDYWLDLERYYDGD